MLDWLGYGDADLCGTWRSVDASDSTEVAVQVGPDVADEVSDPLVANGEPVDHVVGEPGSEFDRVDPTGAVMFVADDGIAVSDLAPTNTSAVSPAWVGVVINAMIADKSGRSRGAVCWWPRCLRSSDSCAAGMPWWQPFLDGRHRERRQISSVCLIIVWPRSSVHRSRGAAPTARATRSEAVLSWSVMM